MKTIERIQNEIFLQIDPEVPGEFGPLSGGDRARVDFRLLSDLELLHACGGEDTGAW